MKIEQEIEGRSAVIFGSTGNVGWGVAKALLSRGVKVIAPIRSADAAPGLLASLGDSPRFHPLVGDPSSFEGARDLAARVARDHGPVDHVVASMGPWWQKGRILDQPESEYRAVMRASLDCHVFAAQAFLPSLAGREGATYTIITGAGAQMSIPGTGLLVVAVSGVLGLSRMLRAEHASDAVRVNEVMIMVRVERAPRQGVVPAEDFGAATARLMQSGVRGQQLEFRALEGFGLSR
jgi:NAD(P)-dependent dehydrogenase (short-subunit alcohol dehydrogenase family)